MSAKSQAQAPIHGQMTWSKSRFATWAVLIALIFAAIVVVYPMMFNPVNNMSPVEEPALPPAAVPVVPAQPVSPGN